MKYEINGCKKEDLQRLVSHAAAIENHVEVGPLISRVALKKKKIKSPAGYQIVFGIYC